MFNANNSSNLGEEKETVPVISKIPNLPLQVSLPIDQQQRKPTSSSHLSSLNNFSNFPKLRNISFDSEKQHYNGSALSLLPEHCSHESTYCKQMGFLYSPHSNQTELFSVTRLPKNAPCFLDADSTLINTSRNNSYANTDSTLINTLTTTVYVDLSSTTYMQKTVQLLSAPTQLSDLTEIHDNGTLIANLFDTAESSNLLHKLTVLCQTAMK